MEEKDYIKVHKATFAMIMFSLIFFIGISIFFQTKYNNQLEISETLCELSNTQSEVIETLYPYFEEEVCSVSEILCNNISRITLPEKFNCDDLR
jgi:hypothetical protein